jgi:thiamine biosynthesis lipoprotein
MPLVSEAPFDDADVTRGAELSRRDLFAGDFGAAPADFWIRVHRRAMACRFEVTLSGEDGRFVPLARRALDEVERIEAALTLFRESSELVRVNRAAAASAVEVGKDLFAVLRLARALHAATEGAFDVTATPLSRCWGFLRREGRLPAAEEIERARACVGMQHVELDEERKRVRFTRAGVELNLGSIGKGYALDRMSRSLRRGGVRHALLSAGGSSVLAVGGRDGGFAVDLRSLQLDGRPLARVRLREGALATSGAGEQFFESQGKRYGHVLDPRSGWTASGTLSATVITSSAAAADALSTAFLIGGSDLARRYCAAHDGVLALVTPEGEARPRISGRFAGAVLAAAEG